MDSSIRDAIDIALERGWAELNPGAVLDIAAKIGVPRPSRRGGPLVDRLRPVNVDAALPRSLSAIHGTGSFPFHVDGSHLICPPRFLVMQCEQTNSARPTYVAKIPLGRMEASELAALRDEVWVLDDGRSRSYANILNLDASRDGFVLRFDRGCMRPSGSGDSGKILERIAVECAERIDWYPGRTILVHNWQALHSRGNHSGNFQEARVLRRVYVG